VRGRLAATQRSFGPCSLAATRALSTVPSQARRGWRLPVLTAAAALTAVPRLPPKLPRSKTALPTPKSTVHAWQYLWKWVKGELPRLAAGACLATAAAVVGLLLPTLLGQLQDDSAERASPWGTLAKLALGVVGKLVLELVSRTAINTASQNVADNIRMDLFAHLIESDIAMFDETSTGHLASSLNRDAKDIRDALRTLVSSGLESLTSVLGGLATLMWISPQLTLGLTGLAVPFVALGNVFGSHLRALAQDSAHANAEASGTATESLVNVRIVRAFNAEAAESDKYRAALDEASLKSREVGEAITLFQAAVSLGLMGLMGTVLAAGSFMVDRGSMSQGQVSSYLVHALALSSATERLSVLATKANDAMGTVGRVASLLEVVPVANRAGGTVVEGGIKGDLEYKNVSFSYPSRPQAAVLDDLSLTIPAGSTVALVGASGAGKTTCGQLLLRFYEPDAGAVFVDGKNLSELDAKVYRNSVAIVPQHPLLFATSVRNNVLYGNPQATDEQVVRALREAQCDFAFDLPEGIDTVLSEGGGSLSGGQKQRLSLARALVKDPRILLLDEATSALDAESERKVQDAIERMCKAHNRTVVIIAHRLSTIQKADKIAVLEAGRVVEEGTHQGLMDKRGVYSSLVRRQQAGASAHPAIVIDARA
jgi:ATP-binding cassette, subfamily B (MDR/TAP), member 8